MNKMRKVAEMLGLEWYEDKQKSEIFSVLDEEGKLLYDDCYISIKGLYREGELLYDDCYISIKGLYREGEYIQYVFSLFGILTGEYTIRKHLREGGTYYILDPALLSGYDWHKWSEHDETDSFLLKNNRLYRTEKEARLAVEKLGWIVKER